MNLDYLYLFLIPSFQGHHGHHGPLTPGSLLATSFPCCPCGPGAPGIQGIPGMPSDPEIPGKEIREQKWISGKKKILIGWKKKQQQKKTVSALFMISSFSPLDPCSPFTPLIPGDPLLPRDPSSPLSPFIPIIPVEPFNIVMRLSGLTIKAFNGAKWHLISFFSSCSRHPSRYLETRLFLSSLENTQVVDIVREITRKKIIRISLKRPILPCRCSDRVSSKSEKGTYTINY